MKVFVIVLLVLLIIYIGILYASYASAMSRWFPIPPQMLISQKVWANMQPNRKQLHELAQEEVTIKSHDGLTLVGHWIPAEDARRTVILCHGWRSRWDIDFANSARWIHTQNCNMLLIEQRAQGKSEGHHMTYGIKERYDCAAWAEWCVRRIPDMPVYLYGTSMGAATVLMAGGMQLPQQVKGVIADSAYTSPYAIIRAVGKRNFHSPLHPTMDVICFFSKLLARTDLQEYSAIEAMRQTSIPVILIHGKKDGFVPCEMSQQNYAAGTGEKQLYLFEGAGHCGSYWKHTQEYQRVMTGFFEKHDKG